MKQPYYVIFTRHRSDMLDGDLYVSIYRFPSERIAKKFLRIRYEEIVNSTVSDTDLVDETREYLEIARLDDLMAEIHTIEYDKDKNYGTYFAVEYRLSIVTGLDLVPGDENKLIKYQRLLILPSVPVHLITEKRIDSNLWEMRIRNNGKRLPTNIINKKF